MNTIKKILICTTTAYALTTGVQAQSAELPSQHYLPLATAQALANEALNSCAANGYNVRESAIKSRFLTISAYQGRFVG